MPQCISVLYVKSKFYILAMALKSLRKRLKAGLIVKNQSKNGLNCLICIMHCHRYRRKTNMIMLLLRSWKTGFRIVEWFIACPFHKIDTSCGKTWKLVEYQIQIKENCTGHVIDTIRLLFSYIYSWYISQ